MPPIPVLSRTICILLLLFFVVVGFVLLLFILLILVLLDALTIFESREWRIRALGARPFRCFSTIIVVFVCRYYYRCCHRKWLSKLTFQHGH